MVRVRDDVMVSDNQNQLDIPMAHGFLSNSYWSKGIDRSTVDRSIANFVCLGLYHHNKQIVFGRAITDRSTSPTGQMCVLEKIRWLSFGKWFIDCFIEHVELQGLRRCFLAALDAHALYSQKCFFPWQES